MSSLYFKIVTRLFKSTIESHRAQATIRAIETITSNIRNDITKLGWESDEDMDAKTYSDIVDKRIDEMTKAAYEFLLDGGK